MTARLGGVVYLEELAASPATPAAARDLFYVKADGHTYSKNPAGTEYRLSGNDLTDSGWQTLTLLNGWTAYGSGFVTPQYRKINGVVYCQGLMTAGATFGAGTVLANLPVGYRPSSQHLFCTIAATNTLNTGATTPSGGVSHVHLMTLGQCAVRMDVSSSGDIIWAASTQNNPGHVDMWGIRFVENS